jgi:hypothetical protein
MDMLLQVNATYLSYPAQPMVSCMRYGISSNSWPLTSAYHYDQPPHWIECDIPEAIARDVAPKSLSMRLDYRALQYDDEPIKQRLLDLAEAKGPDFQWPTDLDIRTASRTVELESALVPHTSFTLCVIAFRHYDRFVGSARPHRFIEWRLYWAGLGVERVVWYAYDDEPHYAAFLRRLIANLGNLDELQCVLPAEVWVRSCEALAQHRQANGASVPILGPAFAVQYLR